MNRLRELLTGPDLLANEEASVLNERGKHPEPVEGADYSLGLEHAWRSYEIVDQAVNSLALRLTIVAWTALGLLLATVLSTYLLAQNPVGVLACAAMALASAAAFCGAQPLGQSSPASAEDVRGVIEWWHRNPPAEGLALQMMYHIASVETAQREATCWQCRMMTWAIGFAWPSLALLVVAIIVG